MKKNKLITILSSIALGIGGLVWYLSPLGGIANITAVSPCWFASTSTLATATVGPASNSTSTSAACDISKTAGVDVSFAYGATTTASSLLYTYEFSVDGVSWFGQSTQSTSGNTVTHVATTSNIWSPASIGTTTMTETLTTSYSKYMRVKVWGTGSTAFVQLLIQKKENQN